jgi:hypothetical protein
VTDDLSDERFSLVYLTSEHGLADSKRVRVANFLDTFNIPGHLIAGAVEAELGVREYAQVLATAPAA